MKEIYICHQYYVPVHFLAIYNEAINNGYEIKDYFIMRNIDLIKYEVEKINRGEKIGQVFIDFLINIAKKVKLKNLHNKILIVGLAPYDNKMIRYRKVFQNNYSIYFTSWQHWDETRCPMGKSVNKKRFEKILKHNFKGIACVSRIAEQQLEGVNRTSVVNHAIEVEKYKKKEVLSPNKIKKFIYIGVLNERKNVRLILQWMKENNVNIEMDFAGDGELRKEVENASENDTRINYLGFLTKQQIQDNLYKYDYIILPSKEEPYGIVLLEALACGVPCIVSNALGPREIILNNVDGFIFDLNNEYVDFDNKMKKAISLSEDDYMKMACRAIEKGKLYSTEVIFEKWKFLFEE